MFVRVGRRLLVGSPVIYWVHMSLVVVFLLRLMLEVNRSVFVGCMRIWQLFLLIRMMLMF